MLVWLRQITSGWPVALGVGLVTSLVVGLPPWLEPLELWLYDWLWQLRPLEAPDDRLLIVQVTEADIQALGSWPPSDARLHELLTNLDRHKPAGIGLDLYRDLPSPPGSEQLSQLFAQNKFIAPVCLLSGDHNPGVAPPPQADPRFLGFTNVPVDDGGVVRRVVIFSEPQPDSPCQTSYAFGFQTARLYLQQQRIDPKLTQAEELQLGDRILRRLPERAGGYYRAETGGYQILLNYRCATQITCLPTTQVVTLSEALQNKFRPEQVQGKVVLIGVTNAPSIEDKFFTPFSRQDPTLRMPGVVIHAQITSQLISTALDGRRPIETLPEWVEVLWLWACASGGAAVPQIKSFRRSVLVLLLVAGGIGGVGVGTFLAGVWVAIATPLAGLATAAAIMGAAKIYQQQQKLQRIAQQVKNQEQDLAMLRSLLQENNLGTTAAPPEAMEATAVAKASTIPQPNLIADRYRLGRMLGAGGFGLIYMAEDTHTHQDCVVKQLQPARKDPRFLEVARRLFRTEGEILALLGDHPQIPKLIDHFTEADQFYLVEEFIPGTPLNRELNQSWPEAKVVDFLQQMLPVLAFIHRHGVIHRDVKPSNILRHQQGRLVLIDFGAVKPITLHNDQPPANLTIAIGTKGYTPPEQYAGQPSLSSDIYALGMVAVHALTGRHPSDLPIDELTGEVQWQHLVNVDKPLATLIERMVRYHFRDRYANANQVIADLKRLNFH